MWQLAGLYEPPTLHLDTAVVGENIGGDDGVEYVRSEVALATI